MESILPDTPYRKARYLEQWACFPSKVVLPISKLPICHQQPPQMTMLAKHSKEQSIDDLVGTTELAAEVHTIVVLKEHCLYLVCPVTLISLSTPLNRPAKG